MCMPFLINLPLCELIFQQTFWRERGSVPFALQLVIICSWQHMVQKVESYWVSDPLSRDWPRIRVLTWLTRGRWFCTDFYQPLNHRLLGSYPWEVRLHCGGKSVGIHYQTEAFSFSFLKSLIVSCVHHLNVTFMFSMKEYIYMCVYIHSIHMYILYVYYMYTIYSVYIVYI